ncbi:germinal center-associated signaling and motility protein [Fukomys damarensis]|uniref:germinal center-associated signaling and motility protein n=1 Tax=Fukomys damarensis TaxID=885580 RepID=UPI0005400E7A|nr:germinal center-associated signaling and motility protein [Fukomys damarensis]
MRIPEHWETSDLGSEMYSCSWRKSVGCSYGSVKRRHQDIQEKPWNPRLCNAKQRTDGANQTYLDEVCYVLINPRAPRKWPSGNSAEEEVTGELYENIPCKANRPRGTLGGTETEYSLLRVPATPKHSPCPKNEYEVLIPSRMSFPSFQQPGPCRAPFETQSSCLQ